MLTYETENRKTPLETFEWDNAWLEQITNQEIDRVLYIGDSISCEVRRIATQVSENSLLVDGFGTSKAVDNPYFMDSIRIFAQQQGKRKAVLFNNGLHGWHLSNEQYAVHYEKILRELLAEFRAVPVFIVLTTAVASSRNEIVQQRNEIACKLAEKYGLKIIDLYTTSVQFQHFQHEDGVHFHEAGYQELAKTLVQQMHE